MARFTKENARQLRATLQDSTVKCSERCLYQSAKWSAELSASLSKHFDEDEEGEDDPEAMQQDDPPPAIVCSNHPDPHEARLERREAHKYLLAKSYFDCREFERCTAVFLPSRIPQPSLRPGGARDEAAQNTSFKGRAAAGQRTDKATVKEFWEEIKDQVSKISQRALFLALYAKFLSGEKKRDEENEMILGPHDRGFAGNQELIGISMVLEGYFGEGKDDAQDGKGKGKETGHKAGDGWLEFLYGMVLGKMRNEEEARHWLLRSVHVYPYNWGAWLELNSLIGSVDELQSLTEDLPHNIMSLIFHLYANQELYQATSHVYEQLAQLQEIFPESQFLKTQKALLNYHAKDFVEAESIFASILKTDPFRLDCLDHYSNILYVMSERPKLAFLAQIATATDKFRPETCCVVGNYYSLKSEHEKAVQYFRRALTLDRHFLSAWTLMGHEYVEMKNTHAAIESYRRAVDVNRRDYRAWYGLGQTYEVLEMHLYALYYYRRAALLHPYDPKMWQAVGACYDKIGKPAESIKAYKRALGVGAYFDPATGQFSGGVVAAAPDGWTVADTLFSIALMLEKMGAAEEAAEYMEMVLAQEDGFGEDDEEDDKKDDKKKDGVSNGIGVTTTTSKARMWLAKWEFANSGLERAMELANELCQDGVEVEEAKALIRDLRARMDGAPAEVWQQ